MSQLLTLSRAARLVGVSRGELQRRIRNEELTTFEGKVEASDLLRLFPEAHLEDDSELERVSRIKAAATPRQEQEEGLPPPEVLAGRLTLLSRELVDARQELMRYAELTAEVRRRLEALAGEADAPPGLTELAAWVADQERAAPQVHQRKTELLARDTFLRLLAAQVRVIPGGQEFFVEGNDTILEAALRAGLALRYGCSNGACGTCKARVVHGDVLRVRDHEYTISPTEAEMGYVLTCSYTAVTDLTLEAAVARRSADLPRQRITARVSHVTHLDPGVAVLRVRTPSTARLRFLPGQSVTLGLPGGPSRGVPLSSCPCDGQNLELHLFRGDGDPLSEAFFSGAARAGSEVSVSGPRGDLSVRENPTDPVVYLAYGNGFAPIKSLVENEIASDTAEGYRLWWWAPDEAGHYMDNRCRAWADALDNLRYHCACAPLDGGIGAALATALEGMEELGRCDVYAAGPAPFLEAAAGALAAAGQPTERVHALEMPPPAE